MRRSFKFHMCIFIFLYVLAGSAAVQGQPSAQEFTPQCIKPELDQVDFLKGAWEVVSEKRVSFDEEKWEESKGTANWTWILDGCVLQERWSGTLDGKPLEWIQLFAYNHREQKWEQGMIDWAHGNLITSDGYYQEGKLVFTTPHMRRGKLLIDKTTIEKMTGDRVNWTIKTSLDGGETWHTFWKMRYIRK